MLYSRGKGFYNLIRKLLCVVVCALLVMCCTIITAAEELPSESYRAVQSKFALLETTQEICKSRNVNSELIFAIMWHESKMQINVPDSPTQDRGLMQINKINWRWLKKEGLDVSIPEQNIEAGVLMLSGFLEKYSEEKALAAYAAGEAGMLSGCGFWFAEEIFDIMNNL